MLYIRATAAAIATTTTIKTDDNRSKKQVDSVYMLQTSCFWHGIESAAWVCEKWKQNLNTNTLTYVHRTKYERGKTIQKLLEDVRKRDKDNSGIGEGQDSL